MTQSHKIFYNTISLIVRIVLNAFITLVSTRIVLNALGADAFGLYNLIGGIIVLLSFFNSALLISTQRFLSIALGEKNEDKLNSIFNVSLAIHILLIVIIILIFFSLKPLLFNGFLDIPVSLLSEAKIIYNIMILSSVITFVGIPYSASILARENIVFFAFSEILVLLFKFFAAISLIYFQENLLLIYSFWMMFSVFVGVLSKVIWCKIKYTENKLSLHKMKDKILFREMIGFISWNTIGSVAVLIRNQGIAVVLNVFFGVIINAAYGIAFQINALVVSFAMALTNVFSPVIIRSKGEGNNKKMLSTAIFSSKLSFLLSSVIAIPLLLFMPKILEIWLKVIPEYTIDFCRLIIISFLILQFIPGINRAIYAHGKIRNFQLFSSIAMLAIIPVSFILFKLNYQPQSVFIVLIISQTLIVLITLFFASQLIDLDAKKFFIKAVVIPTLIFSSVLLLASFFNKNFIINISLVNLILISSVFIIFYVVLYYKAVLEKNEKTKISEFLSTFIKRNIK